MGMGVANRPNGFLFCLLPFPFFPFFPYSQPNVVISLPGISIQAFRSRRCYFWSLFSSFFSTNPDNSDNPLHHSISPSSRFSLFHLFPLFPLSSLFLAFPPSQSFSFLSYLVMAGQHYIFPLTSLGLHVHSHDIHLHSFIYFPT